MAASKKKPQRASRNLNLPAMRAWHVIMANGGDTTIAAHDLDIYSGVLSFSNETPLVPGHYTIVRAFGPNAWHDVELVDTKVTPVHLPPRIE